MGVLLIGTGQADPVINGSSPTARGDAVAFQPSGSLDTSFANHGELRFRSPMESPVWAVPGQGGKVLMVGESLELPQASMHLDVIGIARDGTVEASFRRGPVVLPLPFPGQSWPASAIPVTIAANDELLAVVSSTADRKGLRLVQALCTIFGPTQSSDSCRCRSPDLPLTTSATSTRPGSRRQASTTSVISQFSSSDLAQLA